MEANVNLRYQEYDENDDRKFAMTFDVPTEWLETYVTVDSPYLSLQVFLDQYDSDDSGEVYDAADADGVLSNEIVELDLRDELGSDDEGGDLE